MGASIHADRAFAGTARFALLRRLGEGGMGVVYHAHDREREVDVALKTLLDFHPSSIARLKEEFRTLADVSHPNLISLFDLFATDEHWFFTMELVDGTDFLSAVRIDPAVGFDNTIADAKSGDLEIRETVRAASGIATGPSRGAFRERTLRDAFRQLCLGVEAIHAAGKLHCDLKPSNVLVSYRRRVVILDFGLASDAFVEERQPDRSVSGIVGTPAYMSPEQAAGERPTDASDWYSVGVMLFEALTGNLPFHGHVREILAAKQSRDAPRPQEFESAVPADLAETCSVLLERDPGRRGSGKTIRSVLGLSAVDSARSAVPSGLHSSAYLVGRAEDLAAMDDAHAVVRTRDVPVLFFLEGPSGTGKSHLLQRFVQRIRRSGNSLVLGGRCYERESVPYKAFDGIMDALADYLRTVPAEGLYALLPEGWHALTRVFPTLSSILPEERREPMASAIDAQELRRRAYGTLRETLLRLSERRTVVIVIDDLQWGDADSVNLLLSLVEPPYAPALMFVLSHRQDSQLPEELIRQLEGLARRSGNTTELRRHVLGPLAHDDATELALHLMAAPAESTEAVGTAARIAREAEYNPLFISELVRFWDTQRNALSSDPIEISLDDLLGARIVELQPPLRRFLEVVAVSARPIAQRVAADAARLSPEERTRIGVLVSAALVRTTGEEAVETFHDRIRERVVSRLTPEVLREHHRRLAVALEAAGHADVEALATHYAAAGDSMRAAGYAIEAARSAAKALAFVRAASLIRMALDLREWGPSERHALLIELGDALVNSGRSAAAAEAYLESARGASGFEVLDAKRRAAEQFLRSGHIQRGLELVPSVLETVGMKYPKTPQGALLSLAANRVRLSIRGFSHRARPEKDIDPQDLVRLDTCWSVALGLSTIDNIRGSGFQARHLLLALDAGEPVRVCRALAVEAGYRSTAGGPNQKIAERFAAEAESLAASIGNPHAVGLASLAAGLVAAQCGQWVRTLSQCDFAEQTLRDKCTGVTWEIGTAVRFAVMACFYLGRVQEVIERSLAHFKESVERGDLYSATLMRVGIPNIARLAAGNVGDVRREIRDAMTGWNGSGFQIPNFFEFNSQVHVDLYVGDAEPAWATVQRVWPHLQASYMLRLQIVRVLCVNLRARAAIAMAAATRDPEPYLRQAERDAALIAKEKMHWSSPFSTLIDAAVARLRGKPDAALTLASNAAAGFEIADMALFRLAASRVRGSMLGGEEGAAAVRAVDAALAQQGIVNPERWVAMLAPGVWGPA